MAKETKQDRAIRGMIDQVTEHLYELKNLDASPSTKESDVERWCASFIKSCLGYTSSAGYTIKSQDTKGKLRPDLIVTKDEKSLFLIEVKKIGFDFDKSDFRSGKIQLGEYLSAAGGVKFGMLTNGCEWKLYDFSSPKYGGIEIARFDLKSGEGDTFSLDKRSVEDLSYECFDFHEQRFSDGVWSELAREATAFSPDSLVKAILSSDVVKYIGRSIRGEHDYKVNPEVLADKLFSLLELGLNEAVSGWNDSKVAELQKYVKSQKRATRKTRKRKIVDQSVPLTKDTSSETTLGLLESASKLHDEKKSA